MQKLHMPCQWFPCLVERKIEDPLILLVEFCNILGRCSLPQLKLWDYFMLPITQNKLSFYCFLRTFFLFSFFPFPITFSVLYTNKPKGRKAAATFWHSALFFNSHSCLNIYDIRNGYVITCIFAERLKLWTFSLTSKCSQSIWYWWISHQC